MKNKGFIWFFGCLTGVVTASLLTYNITRPEKHIIYIHPEQINEESFDTLAFLTDPTIHLYEALKYHKVHHPEIVYAQAVLETGWFTSDLAVNSNNYFGLYNSRTKDFFRYDDWHKSIIGYRDMIQYKYRDGEDYYAFLARIGYAEDPDYISKVKILVKKLNFNYGQEENHSSNEMS